LIFNRAALHFIPPTYLASPPGTPAPRLP
jgi:hypothetical protein